MSEDKTVQLSFEAIFETDKKIMILTLLDYLHSQSEESSGCPISNRHQRYKESIKV
jgi:hypothetical protein